MGKTLWIDLSKQKVEVRELEKSFAVKFLGGSGFGIKWLYDLLPRGTDPFSPQNPLIFATGPLNGTRVYGAARHSVISKSPLTGTVFDATSGGFFGVFMKKAGFDAIVISGKAEKPIYLMIFDGKVEFKDARELCGLTTKETIREIRKREGARVFVSAIGPAGEHLVRLASIMNDEAHTAGRGGLGAVMGSKKLKAIAVTGSQPIEEAKPEVLDELLEIMKVRITWNPILGNALREIGTAALFNVINEWNLLPTKNFQLNSFEKAEAISGDTLREKILIRRAGCYNCPIACKRITKTKRMQGDGPEYENLVNLGSMLLIGNIEDVAELNYLCNELGMDTISTGGTLACALELSERGLLPAKIRWGDAEALKKLVVDMAYRRDIGDLLAEGSKRMAERCGAPEVSMNVKGLEVPAYDPRNAFGMALTYGTSYRGACHLRSWAIAFEVIGVPNLVDRYSIFDKPALIKYTQDLTMIYDSIVMCQHFAVEFSEEPLSKMLSAVIGFEYPKEELLKTGERIWNLARLFNLREGFTRKDDMLPERLLKPTPQAPGKEVPYEELLNAYYEVRGWDADGRPLPETLERLDLVDEARGVAL